MPRSFLCSLFFAAILKPSLGQTDSLIKSEEIYEKEPITKYNDLGNNPVMAEYKGGNEALYRFIGRKVKYPNRCRELGISGISMLQFTVTKEGELEDIEPLFEHKSCPEFDKESIRVLKRTSGDWKPASMRGQTVNTRFRLPIRFSLD